ncbi:Putative dehydrogenase/reductase [Podospora comata]|uniref:Dehydrogenase/reductase n=1 Tax=Podospora comata TaxID=48703 RepID=A0ABY6RV99_PODCO|nr:Putative dehydrogenase/reductase [Podospora comata]
MTATMASPDTTIVLITGANQGIGFEIAKKLATEHKDYHIIMTGRRKQPLEEAVSSLKSRGLSVEPLILDVTSDASIVAAVSHVSSTHGRLDVLINNAGISEHTFDNIPDISPRQKWAIILDTNVTSVAMVTDAFIPLMEKSAKVRRIVMMGSVMGSLTCRADKGHHCHVDTYTAYCASKTALNMLSLHYVIRFEKAEGEDGDGKGWKVNVCCPGYCSTNLNKFQGLKSVEEGRVNAVRLATMGGEGETGSYSAKEGRIPW